MGVRHTVEDNGWAHEHWRKRSSFEPSVICSSSVILTSLLYLSGLPVENENKVSVSALEVLFSLRLMGTYISLSIPLAPRSPHEQMRIP